MTPLFNCTSISREKQLHRWDRLKLDWMHVRVLEGLILPKKGMGWLAKTVFRSWAQAIAARTSLNWAPNYACQPNAAKFGVHELDNGQKII